MHSRRPTHGPCSRSLGCCPASSLPAHCIRFAQPGKDRDSTGRDITFLNALMLPIRQVYSIDSTEGQIVLAVDPKQAELCIAVSPSESLTELYGVLVVNVRGERRLPQRSHRFRKQHGPGGLGNCSCRCLSLRDHEAAKLQFTNRVDPALT